MRPVTCPGRTERTLSVVHRGVLATALVCVSALPVRGQLGDADRGPLPTGEQRAVVSEPVAPASPPLPTESLQRPGHIEPAARPEYRIPLTGSERSDRIRLSVRDGLVTLVVREAMLGDVLATLAQTQQLNIVCAAKVDVPISVTMHNVELEDALTSIVSICGCTWTSRGDIVHVTSLGGKESMAPSVQGRRLKVFPLDYVTGEDVSQAIKTMLSPAGSAHVIAQAADNNRRTVESIVVEDLPEFLERIEQYILQMDQPPRQVIIEVHVLQVELEEGCRHGVNFTHMMHVAGQTLDLQVTGFAAPNAPRHSSPS